MTLAAAAFAPGQLSPDVIGLPQYDRRVVVLIGEQPKKGDTSVPKGWIPFVEVNAEANDLRVKFSIPKPWAQPLVVCSVLLYNLSDDHQKALNGKTWVPVRVLAGYGASLREVGTFTALQVDSDYQPSGDVVTKLEGPHGGRRLLDKAQVQLGVGAPYADVVIQLASQVGKVGPAAQSAIKSAASGRVFQWGYYGYDRLQNQLDYLIADLGLEWTIVDDEIKVSRHDESTAEAFVLSPESGLIGSPTPDSPATPQGLAFRFLRAKCLLNPTFKPGAKVFVQSAAHSGFYKCWDVSHTGDTHGQEWYSSLQLKRVSGT